MAEVVFRLSNTGDAAVDNDRYIRPRFLQPIDPDIVQRRDIAIFLRRQSFEPSLAGVNDQCVGTRCDNTAGELVQRHVRILIVDADPALHSNGNSYRALHRLNAIGDQRRLRHQAGAKTAVLHPVRRTTDVEIDFVVAEILTYLSRCCEIASIGPAKLKRDGMFAGIETEQPLTIAMQDGPGRQHLGVEPSVPGHEAVEDTAVPVGPVHHGGHGKAIVLELQLVILSNSTSTAVEASLLNLGTPAATATGRDIKAAYASSVSFLLLQLDIRSLDHRAPALDLFAHVLRGLLSGSAVGLR